MTNRRRAQILEEDRILNAVNDRDPEERASSLLGTGFVVGFFIGGLVTFVLSLWMGTP